MDFDVVVALKSTDGTIFPTSPINSCSSIETLYISLSTITSKYGGTVCPSSSVLISPSTFTVFPNFFNSSLFSAFPLAISNISESVLL